MRAVTRCCWTSDRGLLRLSFISERSEADRQKAHFGVWLDVTSPRIDMPRGSRFSLGSVTTGQWGCYHQPLGCYRPREEGHLLLT